MTHDFGPLFGGEKKREKDKHMIGANLLGFDINVDIKSHAPLFSQFPNLFFHIMEFGIQFFPQKYV